ncbi:uncharacterized protein K452DRAFT_302373 [Aplosporella prunicola CBS 121167]|uniref:DUF221-domain-containing protein n=1 Tax=Aplosporella prunicola CBS 121167 TaxID=1176127 RepID=A0A6A6B0W4_9PEZI|nr:uncharacterized protein K452DRAFT_302373 [Aplosporella prunicola CBS 121167]KAF2136864.1 hypothetical protein K452DRAFT_302373 [Aplosporella prunicola CBS 121167]
MNTNSTKDPLSGGNAGKALDSQNISFPQFAATLVTGIVAFASFFALFYVLRQKLRRIYEPTTYLVPERQRFVPPPAGWVRWIAPVFLTRRRQFIEKCGLDAYFFIRFIYVLLKIFFPLACVLLPILLPLNATGPVNTDTMGLDLFGWANIGANKTNRLVAHLVMALVVIIWVCFVSYTELKNYIQERQKWMTSPSHRIRASATTVLVTNIPDKWCTVDSLDALFDAFPGGLRNIWINRDFGDLLDKKNKREEIALRLEGAETALIRKCKVRANKMRKREEKEAGMKRSKMERQEQENLEQKQAEQMAGEVGESANNPHEAHTLDEQLHEAMDGPSSQQANGQGAKKPIQLVGQGLSAVGQGFNQIGHGIGRGFGALGQNIDRFGHSTAEGMSKSFNHARRDVDHAFDSPVGYNPDIDGADDGPVNDIHIRQSYHPPPLSSDAGALGPSKDHLHRGPEPEPDQQSDMTPRTKDYLHRGPAVRRTSQNYRTPTMQGSSPNASREASRTRDPSSRAPTGLRRVASTRSQRSDAKHKLTNKHLNPLRIFRKNSEFPSPEPFAKEDDEYPLSGPSPNPASPNTVSPSTPYGSRKNSIEKLPKPERTDDSKESQEQVEKIKRDRHAAKKPPIIDWEEYNRQLEKERATAVWTRFIKPEERETMRLSLFPRSTWWWKIWPTWWFSFGKKVDVIIYCRLQLLELNKEIDEDEKNLDKYPLMNSAFIQFNHQVAAHMACQSITHHRPYNMGPRILEIDPKDVKWDNLSRRWWDRYLRYTAVVAICLGITLLWAFPMAFVGSLSSLDDLGASYDWLKWLQGLPSWFKGFLQGALPPGLQAIFLMLLPVVFRLLVDFSGVPTGVEQELVIQNLYFVFIFIQVFLVVSISSSLMKVLEQLWNSPLELPSILAYNLPKASNYFFSYILLQALYSGSQQLAQMVALAEWFVLSRFMDNTARDKFNRQRKIPSQQWGTFFPVYTNFACIGLIYSVIAPLILVFCIIMAAIVWIVWRYQMFYVMRWSTDSGGLFFPRAINQLFTGLYVMELCLVGLFFIVKNEKKELVCIPHAIVMIFTIPLTFIYQLMLNKAFSPLFKFVPITMEDEAQERQEEFERNLAARYEENNPTVDDDNNTMSTSSPSSVEKHSSIELKKMERAGRRLTGINKPVASPNPNPMATPQLHQHHHGRSPNPSGGADPRLNAAATDPELAGPHNGGYLFQGYHDELEDLTPEERDVLVRRAFEHQALRMTQPCIWIPRDEYGVSNDEISRTADLSSTPSAVVTPRFGATGRGEEAAEQRHGIWITNEFTALDPKARVMFRKPPPDFDSAQEFLQL